MTPVEPRYGRASLADVLPSAASALGLPGFADPLGLRDQLAGVRRVGILLIDGLGYHLLPELVGVAPTIAQICAGGLGQLSVLTSGFPSTTPTSLVTLGTGAAPGAHGVLGFTVNIPGTSAVLNHIDWKGRPEPGQWQPLPSMFSRAAAAGAAVTVVAPAAFKGSGLTDAAYRGARYRGIHDSFGLARQFLARLGHGRGPNLVYGYYAELDRVGHRYGVSSPPWLDEAAQVDRLLAAIVAGLPADATLLVTADHGQCNVPADQRFDVDSDPRLSAGVTVLAGEPRVRYLHTQAGARADVVAAWREVLAGQAWVVERDEVVAAGWFGPVPPTHRDRIGDVVAACTGSAAIVASLREAPIVSRLVAYHGSFTAAEMEVPLMVIRGSAADPPVGHAAFVARSA